MYNLEKIFFNINNNLFMCMNIDSSENILNGHDYLQGHFRHIGGTYTPDYRLCHTE